MSLQQKVGNVLGAFHYVKLLGIQNLIALHKIP